MLGKNGQICHNDGFRVVTLGNFIENVVTKSERTRAHIVKDILDLLRGNIVRHCTLIDDHQKVILHK